MNYYTPITNHHQNAFDTCLMKTLQIAATNNCDQILLVVPQRGSLTGVIEKRLQRKAVNALLSKKRAFLSPITFFLQTRRAKPTGFVCGPVLGAYAYFDQLKNFKGKKNIPGIVLYSNDPKDVDSFKKMAPAKELKIIF